MNLQNAKDLMGKDLLYTVNLQGEDKKLREGTLQKISPSERAVQFLTDSQPVWYGLDQVSVFENLDATTGTQAQAQSASASTASMESEAPKKKLFR